MKTENIGRRTILGMLAAGIVNPSCSYVVGKELPMLRIALIGVPTNSAGTVVGVARAPQALRKAGLTENLKRVCDVADYGDVPFEPPAPKRDPHSGIIAPKSMTSMIDAVQEAVMRAFEEKRFPLVLGGDCPVLIGALACFRSSGTQVGLAFIDGHEDAYGPHESLTGEAADMELGLALGLKTEDLPAKLSNLLPLVKSSNVVMLGARDADVIRKDGSSSISGMVEFYNDKQVQGGRPKELGKQALSHLSSKVSSMWLHVDLDSLSTESLPAVDYPQPGGFSWEELESLTKVFLANPKVLGWDVTIYNPDLDPNGKYAARIVQFISGCLMARTVR